MKKKKFTYKRLALEGNLSLTTLTDFQNGAIPRETTVKRMATPLGIHPDEINKKLPQLNIKTRKVTVTLVCGYCNKTGTMTTTRPRHVKYPHKECADAASSKKSKQKKQTTKRIRDSDRVKLMPQNKIYIENSKKREKQRVCLSCNKKFLSRDEGNRICKVCNGSWERNNRCDRRHSVFIKK